MTASVEAAGLVRRAEAEGGFAAILRKGDADRGALILIIRTRGRYAACLERALGVDGLYRWTRVGPDESTDEAKLAEFLEKRARFDEDSWLIELDIAQAERFVAETISAG
ncbi:MAG TPA: DUF1491 family protein [Sphingomicrobium sp.]|nr:DUF1491 family protein [Sphingomicrobium sp.]